MSDLATLPHVASSTPPESVTVELASPGSHDELAAIGLADVAPLRQPEAVPLLGRSALLDLGRVLVAAPHPDDESLGCGGLIAHLADLGRPASVWVVTDGTRSHPGSQAYPTARLRALREAEVRAAAGVLGAGELACLRFPDCGLPTAGTAAFDRAVEVLRARIGRAAPDTLVVPWRRDPHCDHEATWALFQAAARQLGRPPRILEYPVWAWMHRDTGVAPRAGEMRPWRLDVSAVLDRKRAAVAAHVSQTTDLIDDDPDGFVLAPDALAQMIRPWEMYLDGCPDA